MDCVPRSWAVIINPNSPHYNTDMVSMFATELFLHYLMYIWLFHSLDRWIHFASWWSFERALFPFVSSHQHSCSWMEVLPIPLFYWQWSLAWLVQVIAKSDTEGGEIQWEHSALRSWQSDKWGALRTDTFAQQSLQCAGRCSLKKSTGRQCVCTL